MTNAKSALKDLTSAKKGYCAHLAVRTAKHVLTNSPAPSVRRRPYPIRLAGAGSAAMALTLKMASVTGAA